jgi:hypothetical protein
MRAFWKVIGATFRHPSLPVKASSPFANTGPSVHNAPPSPERSEPTGKDVEKPLTGC